jgi:hypothetical protein
VEKREDAVGYVRKIPALAALKNNVLASGAMRQAADDWMEKKIEVARLVVDAVMVGLNRFNSVVTHSFAPAK